MMFSTNYTNIVKFKHKVEFHIWNGIIRSSADTLPNKQSWWKKNPKTKLYSHGMNEERFIQENLLTPDKNKESL